MGRWRDPRTGRTITVEGADPSEDELEEMFASGASTFRLAGASTGTKYGGDSATIGPRPVPSLQARATGAILEGIFGAPEREEAEGTGVAQQPTTAGLVDTITTLGSIPFMAPESALKGALKFGAPVRRAAVKVGGGAAAGAAEEYVSGRDPVRGAVVGAAIGAGLPVGRKIVAREAAGLARGAGRAFEDGRRAASAGKATAAELEEFAKSISATSPNAKTAEATAKTLAKRNVGKEVAQKHNELYSFAKEVAKDNPKVGEKIWVLLDDAGKPLKRLTPDEAGAAARKGLPTTWVKNLWQR